MFRIAALFAAFALSSAVAPPRIELNLAEMTEITGVSAGAGGYKLATPISRTHDLGYTQPDGTAVTSKQDWVEQCQAVRDASWSAEQQKANCPFPVAQAFDHSDQAVSVVTRVFLVDLDGTPCTSSDCPLPEGRSCLNADSAAGQHHCEVDSVDFSQRSTYMFLYDAQDDAGNYAEQVVFALILNDHQAPTLNPTANGCEYSQAVQAADPQWSLNDRCDLVATDNIDDGLTITWDLVKVVGENEESLCTDCTKQAVSNYMPTTTQHTDGTTTLAVTGNFIVTAETCDNAGIYGHDMKNNCAQVKVAIVIADTTPPWILPNGPTKMQYWECCNAGETDRFQGASACSDWDENGELGAVAKDLYDTEQLGLLVNVSTSSNVDSSTVGVYEVTYTATDAADNPATPVQRNVKVADRTAPVISLSQPTIICVSSEDDEDHVCGDQAADGSVTTNDVEPTYYDRCDLNDDLTLSTSWNRDFDATTLGEYIKTYTVSDVTGNTAHVTKKYIVQDIETPTITVMPPLSVTLEASRDTEYTDEGATCSDYVDGVLSHAVEVSGHVVNMRKPGTYVIRYDCQDLSGNQAASAGRTVVIEDGSNPEITLEGEPFVQLEAGFAYNDAGATATDTLDGDLTNDIHVDGLDEITSNPRGWRAARSCEEIKQFREDNGVTSHESAHYYISTKCDSAEITGGAAAFTCSDGSAKQYQRTLVWCDFEESHPKTYYDCFGCTEIAGTADGKGLYDGDDRSVDCATQGMVLATKPAAGFSTALITSLGASHTNADGEANSNDWVTAAFQFDTEDYETTTAYLCSPPAADSLGSRDDWAHAHTHSITDHTKITGESGSHAEAGKYIITYTVSDLADNQAEPVYRTVLVRDTLPPVITLHLKGSLIHTGKKDQESAYNPDWSNADLKTDYAPHANAVGDGINDFPHTANNVQHLLPFPAPSPGLMAERVASRGGVNAWIMGAAVSATMGIAMLAYAMTRRPEQQQLSVPV